jgi:hypothetical protein
MTRWHYFLGSVNNGYSAEANHGKPSLNARQFAIEGLSLRMGLELISGIFQALTVSSPMITSAGLGHVLYSYSSRRCCPTSLLSPLLWP